MVLARGTWPPATRGCRPSCTRIHTSPAAPSWRALSTSESSRLRGRVARSERHGSPARPPRRLKALNSVPATASVKSTSSIAKRRSGLSVPKRSRASFQVIVTISGGRSPVTAVVASITASLTKAVDVGLGDEGRLDVELGELELAVRPQVLVPHAAGDLVVAVEAADHEELLCDLGALRQARRTSRAGAATGWRTRGRPRASASRASASRPRRSPGAPWPCASALFTCARSRRLRCMRVRAQVQVAVARAAPPRRSRHGRRARTAAARRTRGARLRTRRSRPRPSTSAWFIVALRAAAARCP